MTKTEMIAKSDIADLLRPRRSGQAVDPHIARALREPQPDFAEMQRAIFGDPTAIADGLGKAGDPPNGR